MNGAVRTVPSEAFGRFGAFLRRHPVLLLAVLTPGIPEYLLGSSPLSYAVLAPPIFFLNLSINLAIYTGGALLIREALVRWNKGWPSAVVLGAAYAVVEEGLGAATFFNPHSNAVGILGSYGHAFGVNWVFTTGIIGYHTVVSIGVPLLLFRLALPELEGRSLLSWRGALVVMAAMTGAVLVLERLLLPIAAGFILPWTDAVASIAALLALVALARWLPRRLPPLLREVRGTPRGMYALGASFLGAILIGEQLAAYSGLPAAFAVVGLLALGGAFLLSVRVRLGAAAPPSLRVALAAGVVTGVGAFGVLISLPLPITLLPVALAALGLWRLWRRVTTVPTLPAPPIGAIPVGPPPA